MEIKNKLIPNMIVPNLNQDVKNNLKDDNHNINKKDYKENKSN
jgi:hypothetical protein